MNDSCFFVYPLLFLARGFLFGGLERMCILAETKQENMKTIAVVRLPFSSVDHQANVKENLEPKLTDYIVIFEFSERYEKVTIDFYSPELQRTNNNT